MGPPLHLIRYSGFWEGVNPVWFLENLRKHDSEIGQALLTLIDRRLWECISRIIRYGLLVFPVFPNKYGASSHHLEVGPFPFNFIFYSVPGPFLRADEELGSSREVVDLFKSKVVKFTCVVFQVHDDGDYPLGIDETPDAIVLCIDPFL